MTASLDEVGGVPGGDKIRQFLEIAHNDDGTLKGGSGGSSSALKLTGQTQTGHGFTVSALTPVRFNGTSWVKAQADSLADATAPFIAVATDANTFDLYLPGSLIATTGATAGTQWLSPTSAGTMTATQPSTPGQVVVEMGVYISATQFLFDPKAELVVAATPYAKQLLDDSTAVTVADLGSFDMWSDLVGAVLYSAEIMVKTPPSTNAIVVGLKNASGAEVFSTNPAIATGKHNSTETGGTAAVVNTANATVGAGDIWVPHGVTADATTAADRGISMLLRFK